MNTRTSQRGLVLLALLFFITAIAVLLGILIPVYWMQYKRDREAELVFRGAEYARAIQKHLRTYGSLPLTTDEMLKGGGNIPSLRRQYVDPTSGEELRPIYVMSDGTLSGSRLYPTLLAARLNTAQNFAETASTLTDNAGQNPQDAPVNTGTPAPVVRGLVGVGSKTDKMSAKIYVGKDRYVDWEFIAPVTLAGTSGVSAGTTPNPANRALPNGNIFRVRLL